MSHLNVDLVVVNQKMPSYNKTTMDAVMVSKELLDYSQNSSTVCPWKTELHGTPSNTHMKSELYNNEISRKRKGKKDLYF